MRAGIISGAIKPGSQLKQSDIAERLGVSQGPVREALGRLVEEGLVVLIPYRGMFVRTLTKSDVEEIFQARMAIETFVFELVFEDLRMPEHLHFLRHLLETAVETSQNGEIALAANINLHRFLMEQGENSLLIKFWDSLVAQSQYILARLYALDRDANVRLDLCAERILQSISDGDITEGIRWIKNDLQQVEVSLLENWDLIIKAN
jgi:DNA-binding GntR family transcriptional regulator